MSGWLGRIVIKFTFLNVGPLHAASGRQAEFSSIYSVDNLSPKQNSNRSSQWKSRHTKKRLKNLLFYQGTTGEDCASGWIIHCGSRNSGRKTSKLTQDPKKRANPGRGQQSTTHVYGAAELPA